MSLPTLPSRIPTLDTQSAKPAPKRADPFYLSTAWRSLVAGVVRARGRKCERCGREHMRVYADHKHELADGGAALDPHNIELQCGACHQGKSAKMRAARWKARAT